MLGRLHELSDAQKSLLSGGIAGSTGKTVTAPLSRMTVLLQVGAVKQCSQRGSLHSLFHTANSILKKEGLRAFWKGNLTSVIHRFPYSAINFTLYECIRDSFCEDKSFQETPIIRFVAGAVAGSVACAACYPLDLVKTRLTVDSHGHYRGIMGALSTIVRHDGGSGLYRGLTASMVVVVPTLALSYSAYGTIKALALNSDHRYLSKEVDGRQTITFMGGLLCGSLSGIISSAFTFPADLVRRQIQVQGFHYKNSMPSASQRKAIPLQQKPGSVQIIREIYRSSGVRGFFRGFLPEILKITPMVGITFSTFEFCSQFLDMKSRL